MAFWIWYCSNILTLQDLYTQPSRDLSCRRYYTHDLVLSQGNTCKPDDITQLFPRSFVEADFAVAVISTCLPLLHISNMQVHLCLPRWSRLIREITLWAKFEIAFFLCVSFFYEYPCFARKTFFIKTGSTRTTWTNFQRS